MNYVINRLYAIFLSRRGSVEMNDSNTNIIIASKNNVIKIE